MRIDKKLKEQLQALAVEMDMSSTALVKLVLRSFVASPKLEIDLTEKGWNDTIFEKPVPLEDFITEITKQLGEAESND